MAEPEIEWQACATAPGAAADPAALDALDVSWLPATVPGTAASALAAAGAWDAGSERSFDAEDWWWRGTFTIPTDVAGDWRLGVAGLATLADVWVDGLHRLRSENMFVAHDVELGPLTAGRHTVMVRCEALEPVLARRHPRGRWRTRLVSQQHLRWQRTSLLGRIPSWGGAPAPVGPWRPVTVIAPAPVHILERDLRAECDAAGAGGAVHASLRLSGAPSSVTLAVGDISMPLVVTAVGDGEIHASGTAHLAQVERWWPHTHGDQPRRRVVVSIDGEDHDLGSVGFRTVTARTDDGAFGLELNGVPIFCRGACWVPVDPIALAAAPAAQREALVQMRDAGMNMVRVGGTMVYEDDVFYETCDELGILVWQDAMFANMDPPDDEPFLSSVELEIAQLLRRLGARPSLAVFCGGSEIEQQASMLGLPEDKRAIPLLTTTFPALRDRYAPGVPYVSSTPTGGGLPIHTDTGISHYFGVGAYQRPLDDARRAEVRFAAECLAFANVPEPDTVDDAFGAAAGPGHNPEWKRRVPRDNGTGWDFEDVRDHYVAALFGVEPRVVRYADPERYLDLGRAAVAEVMTATFAEWRRPGSPCDGALVWWQRDLWDGAGWGLVDARGVPKSAWWALRRALAPVAVLVTDEGLNGLDVHVFNDRAEPLAAILRVELFGRGELLLERTETKVDVSGRAATTVRGDSLFDGFRDLTWAYRFGPSNHDVVAVTLLGTDGSVLGEAVHLPLGWGRPVEADLGLHATLERSGDTWGLTVGSRRFAQSVRVESPRHNASDTWFHLPPGSERTIVFDPHGPDQPAPKGTVRALNSALVVHFDGDQ